MKLKAREKLDNWLKSRGMKKMFFAEQIGVAPNTVTLWLQGRRTPTLAQAVRIEDMTGISVREWVE